MKIYLIITLNPKSYLIENPERSFLLLNNEFTYMNHKGSTLGVSHKRSYLIRGHILGPCGPKIFSLVLLE
jgi:hypothetical protein